MLRSMQPLIRSSSVRTSFSRPAGREDKRRCVDQRLRVCSGHRGARRREPRLRGRRVGERTDALGIGIAGVASERLQGDGGIDCSSPVPTWS